MPPHDTTTDSTEGLSALLGRKQARFADLLSAADAAAPPAAPPRGSSEVPMLGPAASEPAARPAAPRTILTGLFSRQRGPSGQGSSVSAGGFAFPALGDVVFGFRLHHQLGAGAFARVFLAEQTTLAGRPVVLKISDCTSDEPRTLAQLRHTNIVPVYSVHESPAGLRAVCMPYFGGANLSDVLRRYWRGAEGAAGGERFLAALDAVRAPSLAELSGAPAAAPGPTARDELRAQAGVRAAAWVTARLAAGLQHAHDQGIFHRDVKPSNVLIAEDGQPMLLDFNLSHQAADPTAASIGGTIAYMAPEHLRAIGTGAEHLIREVDHRSDVYSLGMVLFELLTGDIPFDHGGSYTPSPLIVEAMAVEREHAAPSARRRRPEVPRGLDGIVRKCLDPVPARRYQTAADLADDLHRFLADRPLAHAPDRSWTERAAKWARRHPRASSAGSLGAVAAVLLALAGAALVGVRAHLADAREALADARSRERVRAYQAATTRALMLVNVNTDQHDPVAEGRAVCEDALGLFGVLARGDWQADPDWQRLGPDARAGLAADTRELLLSLAWARVRVAGASPAALADALTLLDKAEAAAGPSPGVWHDRALYLRLAGRAANAAAAREQANALAPADARDHYLTATALLRGGEPAARPRAVALLDRAVALDPRFYWAWFQRGVCRLDAGDHQPAAADFGVCVGLWPEFAWGHFNLGLAHDRAGRKADAAAAYDAALTHSPDFPSARLNRGLVRLDQHDAAAALADFTAAAAARPTDPSVHAGRGFALEALGRPAEADAAFARLTELLPTAAPPLRARLLVGYAAAVGRRHPTPAADAFTAALALNPADADAHYGLASLAADPEVAIGHLSRCLAAAPGRKDAALARAVLHARVGRLAEAVPVVERCIDRDPADGAALYAGACVAALAAGASPAAADADLWANKALDLLRKATARGQPAARAAADPDLAALRGRPGFAELLAGRGN